MNLGLNLNYFVAIKIELKLNKIYLPCSFGALLSTFAAALPPRGLSENIVRKEKIAWFG